MKARVLIVMGSDSDLKVMEEAAELLDDFGIPYEMTISSAHRCADRTAELASGAEKRGIEVIIAGAGMAAHLAGVMAAHTTLPVIGVPLTSSPLDGMDALLSTVQMPPGVPVATMSLGKAGAKNAAVFTAQILAGRDVSIRRALKSYKRKMASKVEKKAAELEKKLAGKNKK